MGKGSVRRPGQIPDGAWEKIFGKKENNDGKSTKEKDSSNAKQGKEGLLID